MRWARTCKLFLLVVLVKVDFYFVSKEERNALYGPSLKVR